MEQHKCAGCGKFVKGGSQCSCGSKLKKEPEKEAKKKAPTDEEIFAAADKVAKKLPIDKNKPILRKGFAEQLFNELDSDEEDEDEF